MALSLVYGPVDIVARDATDWFICAQGSGAVQWVEGLGLVALSDWGTAPPGYVCHGLNLYAVRLDGTAIRFGARTYFTALGWHANADDAATGDLPILMTTSLGYACRARLPATYPVEATWAAPAYARGYADLPDRVIWYQGGAIRTGVRGTLGSTVEATIAGADGPLIPAEIGPGRSLWYAVSTSTGAVYVYDAIAKAEIVARRTGFGSAVRAAAYSRKHGVFVVVRRDVGRTVDQLYVYANEPIAATVSAPTLSGSPVGNGRSHTASARVLGDLGEPCADRVVTFSATHGTFTVPGVRTDSDGWARTTYRAPLAATVGVQITATLTE